MGVAPVPPCIGYGIGESSSIFKMVKPFGLRSWIVLIVKSEQDGLKTVIHVSSGWHPFTRIIIRPGDTCAVALAPFPRITIAVSIGVPWMVIAICIAAVSPVTFD